jgi:hypothetical protein
MVYILVFSRRGLPDAVQKAAEESLSEGYWEKQGFSSFLDAAKIHKTRRQRELPCYYVWVYPDMYSVSFLFYVYLYSSLIAA